MLLFQMIKDINQFILHPEDTKLEISFYQKISIFLVAFSYKILGTILFIGLGFILDEFYELESSLASNRWTFSSAFFSMVIFAPLIEELIFRFPLMYKRNYIFRGIEKVFNINLHQYWTKYFRIIFYLFALGFGYLHLTNYKDTVIALFLLSPIIVGGKIWGGLIYGYLRIKLGFLWNVFAHFLNNGMAILLLLLSHNTILIDITNEQMKLKITQLYFIDKESINRHYYHDNGNIISISAEYTEIQTILDQVYRNHKQIVKENSIINLTLKARKKEGITKEELLIELKKEFDIVTIPNG